MVKIDVKDKKILYQLINNSRQPLSSISKKVGLSREVVNYRINRLEKEGIIINYPTLLQLGLIGIFHARFYYNYQFMNPTIKNELIEFFKKSEVVEMIGELEGSYDLKVTVYSESKSDPTIALKFAAFYEELQRKYRRYFDEQIGTFFTGSDIFDLIFLLEDKKLKPSFIKPLQNTNTVEIDNLDMNILRLLAGNARIPIVQLADELDVTINTVKNRLKILKDKNVFWKFTALIDWSKIGYRQYDVEINLKDYNKIYDIINYIRNNQHILFIMHSIGREVDLDFEFVLRDITHLQSIITDLSARFPESIKNFKYFSTLKIHKWSHIPFR